MMKSISSSVLITFFAYLVSNLGSIMQANCQETSFDVTGNWQGTYSWLNKEHPLILDLSQNGRAVTGFGESLDPESGIFFKYNLKGLVKKDKLTLTALEFIRKEGTACLPTLSLNITEINGTLLLNGRWKPNARLGGCIIGASGRLNFFKDNDTSAVDNGTQLTEKTFEPEVGHGIYTREVIKGLKKRRYHALILGIDKYDSETIPDLENPILDGERIQDALIANYTFQEEDITFLRNPGRAEILDALQKLGDRLTSTDNLLIYYAGHGFWDDKLQQGYWLPADASKSSRAQWISNATIRDYVRAVDSQHTLLIADACFSGGLLKQRDIGKAMINLYKMPSRKAMTSGTLTTVPDQSVFANYLVKYLRDNKAPLLSADQIFYKIKISVINNSPTNQVPQYGPIHQANDEGGEFIFLKKDQ